MIFTLMAAEQEARRRRDFFGGLLNRPYPDKLFCALGKDHDWIDLASRLRDAHWKYELLTMKFRGGWMRRVLAADKGVPLAEVERLFDDEPGENPSLAYPEAASHILDMFGPT